MSLKLYNSILILSCILTILFASTVVYRQWNLGDNESDFKTVCIGNYQYFKASFLAKGLLAINLDDNGKPVKCK